MEGISDPQLLQQIGSGQLPALTELYQRHASTLLGLLVRIVPQKPDAEDLLQEVFMQVWRDASKFSPERGQPLVWMALIARSRALDHLRKSKRLPKPTACTETAPAWEKETDALETAEHGGLVRGALAKLPSEQSEPISMAFYDGLTHKEIAQLQGLPLGTIKTRIRQGMLRMRDILAQQIKVAS